MRAVLVLPISLLLLGPAAATAPESGAISGLLAQADPAPQPLPPAPEPAAPVVTPPAAAEPAPEEPGAEDLTEPDPSQPATGEDDGMTPDDLSLGEIPVIETMELTADIARRALDSYLEVRTKFQDADLESYENLQDFVDQTPDGKTFEADIKAAGFANVNDWNLAITAVGFAYSGVVDDQSADIAQQIAELEADTELAQDMKDRMIKSLKAMVPSENNKKVIEELMADPAYAEKLKQIDIVEE